MRNRIRVNGLNIGWMDTPGEDRIQTALSRCYRMAAEGARPTAQGRMLKPDEVARAVAYLASGKSGLMTGSIIDFDQQVLGSNESAPHPSEPSAGRRLSERRGRAENRRRRPARRPDVGVGEPRRRS